MKRDDGVTEVIGGLMLIAITVAGAVLVLSFLMAGPDVNPPVLDYYGCTDQSSPSPNKCITHFGGATLLSGTYYIQGFNDAQQPVTDTYEPDEDFRLGTRFCTNDHDVEYIGLFVSGQFGEVLHGLVSVGGSCFQNVGCTFGGEPFVPCM